MPDLRRVSRRRVPSPPSWRGHFLLSPLPSTFSMQMVGEDRERSVQGRAGLGSVLSLSFEFEVWARAVNRHCL